MPCATSHFKENKATVKRIQLKCVQSQQTEKLYKKKKTGYEREKRGGTRDLKAGLRKEA